MLAVMAVKRSPVRAKWPCPYEYERAQGAESPGGRAGVQVPAAMGIQEAATWAPAFYSSSNQSSVRGNMEYRAPMSVLKGLSGESGPLATKSSFKTLRACLIVIWPLGYANLDAAPVMVQWQSGCAYYLPHPHRFSDPSYYFHQDLALDATVHLTLSPNLHSEVVASVPPSTRAMRPSCCPSLGHLVPPPAPIVMSQPGTHRPRRSGCGACQYFQPAFSSPANALMGGISHSPLHMLAA